MAVGAVAGIAAFLAGMPGPLHAVVSVDLGLLIAYALSTVTFIAVSLMTRRVVASESLAPQLPG
jgi:hypothetical protein